MHPVELDWMTTLSRIDFPWQEIKFAPYSAKECFETYQVNIKDLATFMKKVIGRNSKLKSVVPQYVEIPLSSYCYCGRSSQLDDEIFVECANGANCPYGGWFHLQCLQELKHLNKDQIEEMGEWRCKECEKLNVIKDVTIQIIQEPNSDLKDIKPQTQPPLSQELIQPPQPLLEE